jgi:hypothetical protein
MLTPEAIVPNIHYTVAVNVSDVGAVGLPEVLAPDAIVPNVDDAIVVQIGY